MVLHTRLLTHFKHSASLWHISQLGIESEHKIHLA